MACDDEGMYLARLAVAALLLLAAACYTAQAQVVYNKLEPEVIAARLQRSELKNSDRLSTLKDLFTETGCGSNLETPGVKGAKLPNVVCTLPGEIPEQIIIGAHFDKVFEGEGVIDNWSGAALLVSLYQSLKQSPRKHTLVFIGFSAEEEGLIGSRHYVKKLTKERRAAIRAMVNMDTLALGPLEIAVSGSDKRLVQIAARVAHSLNIPVKGMNVHKVGMSDSKSFRDAKVPVIEFHSLTAETLHLLHGPGDNFKAVKEQEYYQSYQFLAVFLAYIDQQLPLRENR
jgi:hypothetical protein